MDLRIQLLNARGRLCRVHESAPERSSARRQLLNARGRLCRVHSRRSDSSRITPPCSTPGGVFVGFTPAISSARGSTKSAQRPGASLSGSHAGGAGPDRRTELLNARGRLCRVHSGGSRPRKQPSCCSTPGGVFVGFTINSNSRPTRPGPAQRPGASLSGSPVPGACGLAPNPICSTPGGVFVGFTCNQTVPRHACRRLLNARGRLCRVHGTGATVAGDVRACSTPGGVFVGFTASRCGESLKKNLLNARGRLCRVHHRGMMDRQTRSCLLNARGRLCRVHVSDRHPYRRSTGDCSTPGGVFVGFTLRHRRQP